MLFCDVVGSTALGESVDPEALQGLLARYFERMKGIVESHGGSVEKFIGDAVMAVFGVPVAHEDDALRACRAAVEMRDALPELGVEGRIGVNTGEVLTGTEERLATGDAVNVAARLEQAAEPGEVLIGAETLALVAGRGRGRRGAAARAEGQERAGRRLSARRGARSRRSARTRPASSAASGSCSSSPTPGIGALAGPRCELVTVVGDPGVGKSRLVAEALDADRRAGRARPLPLLRRGDHLLAGGRGGEAARRGAERRAGRERDPIAARGERRGVRHRRDRLGVPEAARGAGAARRLLRRHPVGRRRRSSISSSRPRCSRPARRSCSSAWRGPSCSTAVRDGR